MTKSRLWQNNDYDKKYYDKKKDYDKNHDYEKK